MYGWHPFDDGRSVGQKGSEGGSIIRDDEHDLGARITLERDGSTPYGITCGIYGWMVHTRFFSSEEDASKAYEAMRVELESILKSMPLASDKDVSEKSKAVSVAIGTFIERFP